MEYEKIKELADEFVKEIKPFCEKFDVCGSIRRKKANCKDIDIVLLPKDNFNLRLPFLQGKILNSGKKFIIETNGQKLVRLNYQDVKVDIYIATPENYEVLKLIRTGSAEHNKKLCQLALDNGMHLRFDKGLIDADGSIIANTEEGILKELLGKYVEPEVRN